MINSEFFDGKFDEFNNLVKEHDMKKRKLIDQKKLNYYIVSKGENFSDKLIVKKADLTMEDINKGFWKDEQYFKGLNLKAKGKDLCQGGLHPLMKLRS